MESSECCYYASIRAVGIGVLLFTSSMLIMTNICDVLEPPAFLTACLSSDWTNYSSPALKLDCFLQPLFHKTHLQNVNQLQYTSMVTLFKTKIAC